MVSRAHVRVLSVDVGVKIKTRGFQSATATAPMDVGMVCVVLTEERTDEEVLGVLHYVYWIMRQASPSWTQCNCTSAGSIST